MALWTPAELGADLHAWLKADAITGLADNDPVATWEDATANNRDAVQGTGTNQPLYKTNVQNGLPAVRFDNTDDWLDWQAGSAIAAQPFAAACAVDMNNNSDRIFTAKSNAVGWHRVDPNFQIFGANTVTYAAANANWNVHAVVWNGAGSLGSLNGTASAALNVGAGAPTTGLNIGSDNSPPGADFGGDLGELLLITGTSATDTDARQLVEGYLAHKWGTALAAGHPYEDAAPTVGGVRRSGLRYPIYAGLRNRTLR